MYDNLYQSLVQVVSFFNRPRQDKKPAAPDVVALETALYPLLMWIGAQTPDHPMTIVGLAGVANRDHSTVSRQVDQLAKQGLITIMPGSADRRVRLLVATPAGQAAIKQISAARRQMMQAALEGWTEAEIGQLDASLTHLIQTLQKQSS